jgi:hypothetical protein
MNAWTDVDQRGFIETLTARISSCCIPYVMFVRGWVGFSFMHGHILVKWQLFDSIL